MTRTIAHNRAVQVVAAGFMMLVLAAYAASAATADDRGAAAEAFIRDLAANGMAMLETSAYTDAERERDFRRLARKGFALNTIGQFVAGRHWRAMSDDQRTEFQDLFAEWLLSSYARRLGGYSGQSLEIVTSLELQNAARDIVVRTRVVYAGGQPPVAAEWRTREFNGGFKIIDVIVEGVSMAAAQRAEFDAVMRKIGVEGLLANLRSRLAVLVAGNE
ncbi:MAG: ABC transporter substrate-binding protein [Alphaproteobacteria bacterium]|nr:ABC transporter substrate-binding protein [Alphaproteobacteria bacterium]